MTSTLSDLPVLDDLKAVLLSGRAMIDVRAPVEFAEGAFPSACNLPLMNDAERQAIGICYKEKGQDAAIALGHERVSGVIKVRRVEAWQRFVEQHPDGLLYCFRGGLRSRISQQWIYEQTGILYPRVQGGYKAMRRQCLEALEPLDWLQPLILSGRTGSGKTLLLKTLRNPIDLEGLANHRGSAFGHHISPQPTQIAFENHLAIELMRQQAAGQHCLVFEDESANVGSVHIPKVLRQRLVQAPLVILQVPNHERVEISYQEYVVDMMAAFSAYYPEPDQALLAFSDYLLGSLKKVKRRLGGERYQAVQQLIQEALTEQQCSGDLHAHREWVQCLLLDYYDPMYDYQLSQKQDRVVFQGDSAAVSAWLADNAETL